MKTHYETLRKYYETLLKTYILNIDVACLHGKYKVNLHKSPILCQGLGGMGGGQYFAKNVLGPSKAKIAPIIMRRI